MLKQIIRTRTGAISLLALAVAFAGCETSAERIAGNAYDACSAAGKSGEALIACVEERRAQGEADLPVTRRGGPSAGRAPSGC
jgi:hypothetical protein